MRKKWLALLLTLVMLFSLSVPALAAEVRETDFFTDQWHSEENFEDMEYVAVDTEAVLAEMEATRALVEDEGNIDAVREGFLAACELSTNARTMYTLANIRYSQDYANEENFNHLNEAQQAAMIVGDALYGLARDILNSPCAAALDDIVNEEDAEYLRDYENMTDEELAMEAEITALEDEYQNAAFVEYTAVVDGVEWTDAANEEAYYNGEIDYDQYIAISRAIAKEMNAVLGEIYLRIVDAHKRQAAMEEYESYADYVYENEYNRDYTPLEIRQFHDAVKANIAPLQDIYYNLFYALVDIDLYFGDFAGDVALDIMDPYIASMSSELYEAFTYMREHNLYDSGYSDLKDGSGFSTILAAYQAPYFFNTPTATLYDLTTAVHEFGHYNNFYWTDGSWYNGSKDYDTSEVHSQGLELLFTEFYKDIFGDSGDFVTVFILYNMVSAIVEGALHDELQQFAFETEDVTLQQINEKYCQLCREYNIISPDDERTEMYGWVEIHHTFDRPFYYISYAASAAGALEFWLEAQEDYFAGVDDYLRFTAQKMDEYGFQEAFEAIGMKSPVDPEFIASLGEELILAAGKFGTAEPAEDAVVYVSISVEGEVVAPSVPVLVSDLDGDGSFNVDEVLTCAHDQLYPGGAAAGYASSVGDWGLSVDMLWGDTSYAFSYYVDNAMAWGLTDTVEAGGSVYAFVYADQEFYSDAYAYFDQTDAVAEDGSLTLTLYAGSFDEDWNVVFAPCAGATITIDGAATEYVTDENGQVTVNFDEAGSYLISAVSEDAILVPAICKVTAEEKATFVPEPEFAPSATYTVQEGDTLRSIARQFYGNSAKWTLIYEANYDAMSGPSMISVGQELLIP